MRCLSVFMVFAAFGLLAGQTARGDDEVYAKVELKGYFRFNTDGPERGVPRISIKREMYELDLRPKNPPRTDKEREEVEKEAKKLDGKLVIVKGNLQLRERNRPLVLVSEIKVIPGDDD